MVVLDLDMLVVLVVLVAVVMVLLDQVVLEMLELRIAVEADRVEERRWIICAGFPLKLARRNRKGPMRMA